MEMKQTTEEAMVNKRLTSILKGSHERLTMIQVPTYDWFYSEKSNELFHYSEGVFECYPSRPDGTFFPHPTLKVLEGDAVRVNVALLPNEQGYSITNKLPEANFWRDVTDQKELEELLLQRNKRHLQQIEMEEGPSMRPPISDLCKNFGINPTVDKLLENGTITSEHNISPEMHDWFECVQKSNNEESTPVMGCMTKKQYQKSFRQANEKVSSGGSGLHYTLWKAMAAQDDMAEFLCIMISLPFMYGFACERWLHAIDVMLEKKKGIRKIHMLRIIGLIEADFNTALKFYFAYKMMENAGQDGLTDEQWGGRRNRSSVDAAMLKLLTFECAQIKKATIADTMYDLVACFDRMKARLSNVIAQRALVDKKILIARATVIERLRRSVKTGLGISVCTYGQEDGEKYIDGEVQGKGDVPSLWGKTSDTLLRAHAMGTSGLELKSPDRTKCIKCHNVCFVDDNNGLVSADHDSELPTDEAKDKMQHSAQRWNNIVNIPHQTVAFHKSAWSMAAWEEVKRGELSMSEQDFGPLEIIDHHGGKAVINYLSPKEPNVGLGYRACPNGDHLQLESGFVTPLFESKCTDLVYVEQGWLISLRNRCHAMDATLWIEDAWSPNLQRENDVSLMEQFLRVYSTSRERKDLSACLKYMGVTPLADLADENGREIPACRLTGEWRAESEFEWPRQPRPGKRAWATLRRFLRETLCFNTSAWQPINIEMELSQPLGKWLDVDRNVKYQCYRNEHCLFWREEGTLSIFRRDTRAGYYKYAGEVESLPPKTYPIQCQWVNQDSLWTHRPYRIVNLKSQTLPPGRELMNTINRNARKFPVGSDGSVFHKKQVAAAAWIIASDHDSMTSACFVLCNVSSVSSTRAELEGSFRSLKHIEYLGLEPEETERWIDNLTAVRASDSSFKMKPKNMLDPDADLVLAIQAITKSLTRKDSCKHVYSHQDERKRGMEKEKKREYLAEKRQRIRSVFIDGGMHAPTPEQSSDSESDCSDEPKRELARNGLSDDAHLNNACDIIAKQTAKSFIENDSQPVPQLLNLPYAGSKAMLRIGSTYITSRYDYQIHMAARTGAIRTYCLKRHKWSHSTFKSISWEVVEKSRCAIQSITKLGRSSKLMHDWLPHMHNLGKWTGVSQCPGCKCPNETLRHVFQCPHKLMVETRTKQLAELDKHIGRQVPPRVKSLFKRIILAVSLDMPVSKIGEEIPPELLPTLKARKKIGLLKMLQGFLSRKWIDGMEAYGEKFAPARMKVLFSGLWDIWFEPIWEMRNFILHKTPNKYNQLLESSNEEKLKWYRDNRHELLAFVDRDFVDHSNEEIQAMTQKTKHEWVKRLTSMSESYKEELKLTQVGQRVMTEFIGKSPGTPRRSTPVTPAESPRMTQQTLFDSPELTIKTRPSNRRRKKQEPQQPAKRLVQRTLFETPQPFRRSRRSIEGELFKLIIFII
ncbi:hypothetical protein ACHAXN_004474 [Cyclotella atomus]